MNAKPTWKHRGAGGGTERPHHEASELTRLVAIDDLPAGGLDVSLRAEPGECAALAGRGGVVAVESLAADLQVRKVEGSKVAVAGALRARVVQTCVVSLEPFEHEIEFPIEAEFADDNAASRVAALFRDEHGSEPISSGEVFDAPDPIIDGRIDLGALVAEFLMLALDPYPRKPGASFEATGDVGTEAETLSPFAALRALRGSGKDP